MKKMMLLALAIVLALVATVPVFAQNRYYDPRPVGAIEMTDRNIGMVNSLFDRLPGGRYDVGRYDVRYGRRGYPGQYGRDYRRYDYGYNSHSRYDRYGYDDYGMGIELNGRTTGAVLGGVLGGVATRNSRNGWTKAAGILGGAVLGGVLGNQIDNKNNGRSENEEVSKCFDRIVKSAKKHNAPVDTNQVMATCSGQSLPQPQPEMAPEMESMPMDARENRVSEPANRVVRNSTDTPVAVYQGEQRLCVLDPGGSIVVEAGNKLGFEAPASCDFQAMDNGSTVTLSCR